MRRRFALWSLAVTTLVVVAFTVPLGAVVRRQAVERAQVRAERQAQSTASLVALAVAVSDQVDPELIAGAVGSLREGEAILLPDGSVLGTATTAQLRLAASVAVGRSPVASYVEDGWAVAIPVLVRDGVAVVSVFVPEEDLTQGVTTAWVLLASLGLVVIVLAVAVADALGRRLVSPIDDLIEAARRLGEGDLTVQVTVDDPEELAALAGTFNWLARRLDRLLVAEREALADLSHRLRTPLTVLRLQSEQLADPGEAERMTVQVDRLERAVDQLINEVRRERAEAPGRCDLTRVAGERAEFWRVLAEDQGRTMRVVTDDAPLWVELPRETVASVVDTLVENVFNHTPAGVPLEVSAMSDHGRPLLQVADQGPGFPSLDAVDRGVSGAGSTGLGLDIVRRTAALVGGRLDVNDRPGGGAVVRVWLA